MLEARTARSRKAGSIGCRLLPGLCLVESHKPLTEIDFWIQKCLLDKVSVTWFCLIHHDGLDNRNRQTSVIVDPPSVTLYIRLQAGQLPRHSNTEIWGFMWTPAVLDSWWALKVLWTHADWRPGNFPSAAIERVQFRREKKNSHVSRALRMWIMVLLVTTSTRW